MNVFNLSFKERAQMVWMFTVLKKLDPDEEKNYNWRIEVLSRGYKKEYRDAIGYEIMSEDEVSCEMCEETRDILRMYTHMKNSYLQIVNKDGIDKNRLTFKGFNNSEESHLPYTTFLLEQMNQFQQLQNTAHDYETHSPIIEKYRHMLIVYHNLTNKDGYQMMTKETLIAILKVAP